MPSDHIGVAVVGAGMAGRSHAAGYRSATTTFGAGLPAFAFPRGKAKRIPTSTATRTMETANSSIHTAYLQRLARNTRLRTRSG